MKLADAPTETLVEIIEQLYLLLEQPYVVLPGSYKLTNNHKKELDLWQPANALCNVIYASDRISPDYGTVPLSYKPLSALAIEYLEAAGVKLTFPNPTIDEVQSA